jgi:hypothetical protein
MSTWYAQESGGAFQDSTEWNSAQDGSGSYGTPADSDTCDLNGKMVQMTADPGEVIIFVDSSDGSGLLEFVGTWEESSNLGLACNVKIPSGSTISFGCNLGMQIALTFEVAGSCDMSASTFYFSEIAVSFVVDAGATLILQSGGTYPNWYDLSVASTISVAGTLHASCTIASVYLFASVTGSGQIVYYDAIGDVIYTQTASSGTIPAASDVRYGVGVGSTTGTCHVPTAAQTLYGVNVDVSGTGTVTLPNTDGHTANAALVLNTAHFGAGNATAGTYSGSSGTIPAASDVRHGVAVGSTTGTCYVPSAANTRYGISVDATQGTCHVPTAAQTYYGVSVDVSYTGTLTLPGAGNVLAANGSYGEGGNGLTPTLTMPGVGYVSTAAGNWGVGGNGSTGTRTDCPAADALEGTSYGAGGTSISGTLTLPSQGNVLSATGAYGPGGTGYTPSLTLPGVGYVSTAAGNWGVNGSGSTGTLNMSLYVLISALPAVGNVASGVNRGDGNTGTRTDCPAADALTGTSYGAGGTSISGTLAAGVYPAAAYVHADAGSYGPTGHNYTPALTALADWTAITSVVSPEYVLIGIPCYTGGPNGTAGIQNSLTQSQVTSLLASYGIVTPPAVALTPVAPNGDLSLVQGVDYCSTLGNLLVFDASDWPNLTGAIVTLTLHPLSGGSDMGPITGVIENAGASNQSVQFTLTHTETAGLSAGVQSDGRYTHTYTLEPTWSTGLVWAPARGNASVYAA